MILVRSCEAAPAQVIESCYVYSVQFTQRNDDQKQVVRSQ
jgi:hypothetical protein